MTVTANRAAARKSAGGAARKSSAPGTGASARGPARAAGGGASEPCGAGGPGEGCPGGGPAGIAWRVLTGPGAGSGRAAAGPGGVPVQVVPVRHGRMLVSPFTFSTGALRCRWRRTSPACWPWGCGFSSAGTPTCRISARSRRRSGGWSSTSTTSTRPCPARSNGMSSGWPRAWPWPGGPTGSPPRTGARSPWRRPRATAPRCGSSPGSPSWTCGTRTWTSAGHRRIQVPGQG